MEIQFLELQAITQHSDDNTELLQTVFNTHLPALENHLVQDLNHISQAARYAGDMKIDHILYLKDNLYRCDYSYKWDIAWTCSGTQETGRITEKVRFVLNPNGQITFKFLTLDA